MDFLALAPLMAPAALVVVVAVVITIRERRAEDTVLDLTEVPRVRLAEQVSHRAAGTARPAVPPTSAVRPRRRGTPLVAGRR